MKVTLHYILCHNLKYYLTQWTDSRMPYKRGTDSRGSTVTVDGMLTIVSTPESLALLLLKL